VKRVALGAALLCWATACATPIPFRPLSIGDPRPGQLLDNWAERASQRQRLRGLARLAVDRADGSVQLRGKQLVVLERPSRLRVEILGFLNQSLAVVATDGEDFEVYRADDQSYAEGKVDAQLLWNEAGIDLSPEEAVAVLLGVPVSEPLPAPANAVRDAEGRIRIDLTNAQGAVVQRVTFDAAGRLQAFEALDDSGAVLWVAQFDAYRDVDGSAFAHSIQVDVRSGKTRAEISFRNVELNPDLPPGMFRLFPAGEGVPSDADRR
jgi:outer membrane lipoprotein-sorting protein